MSTEQRNENAFTYIFILSLLNKYSIETTVVVLKSKSLNNIPLNRKAKV